MRQAIIDKEPEVIEYTVMQHGVIEIEGLKYLAAPLATLDG
ncbi:hypothetical protein [Candidatus Erwinia dacicola]|uniref:Uncharacterized protein n=1 Tax=Candidatus Erwinia dacicola TaxID=252393 RepID=A0A328TIZ4_9GAMM|nr:hypothetical protein [Candidatus Erwinia dacicola]RAP70428.1 hypothetical protein ACZ87_02765 [Candidatus Erwinia dacicola]